jgi:hypothetical protein
MADNLKITASAAGLTPEEQKKLDEFNKALAAHKELSNLPSSAAQAVYNKKSDAQKASLNQYFGNEDPVTKPNRGWLGTAWHYTGGAVLGGVKAAGSGLLAGLGNVSDFSTRVARTVLIAGDQGLNLGEAWTVSNDKGDTVFSPGRIADVRSKFGNDAVDVALQFAAGKKPAEILKDATPEQQKYIMLIDKNNRIIPGFGTEEDTSAARENFQDTLDAVNAAKYSPGRFVANLVTPRDVEGSGLFYKAVSGAFDAAYRVLADPLLIAGKAKRGIDVMNYALDVVVGGNKVEQVFARPQVQNFWNQYGQALQDLTKAEASKNPQGILDAKQTLRTLAPEFGDPVIKSFQTAKIPVQNADTAKAFFLNADQTKAMITGSAGRQRIIIPQMDAFRQARIAAVTTGRKVFNIDRVGPKLTDDYFFGGATTTDGIAEVMINGQKQVVNEVKANQDFKGIARFSTAYLQNRIDKIKALATPIPIFEKEVWDVTSADAGKKIFQLARVGGLPEKESKLLAAAFDNMDDVGKRKDVYYGLWATISELRGLNTTAPGQQIVRYMLGKGQAVFGLDDAYREVGSMPSDFTNFVAAPGLQDLDRAAARNTLFQKLMGIPNTDFANKMTSAWSFLTLAGPRYALRNAGEDLMVNLAIGQSPWGLAKQYHLSNRINTFLSAAQKAEGAVKWSDNPLGMILRFTNRRDVNRITKDLTGLKEKFDNGNKQLQVLRRELQGLTKGTAAHTAKADEIAALQKDLAGGLTQQAREIFADALTSGRLNTWRTQLGLKPYNQQDAELLKEHIRYGNLENSLGEVTEAGLNTFTGNDFISRAQNLVKQTGVSTHELTITPGDFAKKPGERGFKPQAVSDQDPASLHSWMFSISRYANDELGSIAVANLSDDIAVKAETIGKMVNWMTTTKNGQKFLKDARLSNNMSAEEIANLNYNRARDLFLKKDGRTINEELLNKVRIKDPEGNWKISGSLTVDDLASLGRENIPNAIIGPTLVPAVELDRMAASIVQNGWTFLGLSNARMSRQPIVLNEIVTIRKQFRNSGFEDAWIKSYQRGIDPTDAVKMEKAKENALKELATVVEERAIQQTLAYVDNPLIRSQLSWNLRNFARFYRATEDFYRRMYRVVRYNPEALVKAALTYEGITHSGFVQKDDQGESYFVYPGIAPVYNAVQKTLDALGIGNRFKAPLPIEFGAKIKMLTPSLNPDSVVPTFSGPLAGISIGTISQLVSIFNPGAADTIRGYALGKYATDQPFLSLVLPAHINRLYAAMNQDERNSQYASAWRKAVTYLEASGHGLKKNYDKDGNLIPPSSQELEDYRQMVKQTTLNILGMRFAFGFFAPASPQVQLKSDMAQWVSDNGNANFKQLFNNLLEQYPGDYNAAMQKWVELFPKGIAFTLTESERKSIAPLRYAQEAGDFVANNESLFNQYPKAAAFLIPHKSGFSWDAYKSMKDLGLIQNKRVDDYLREVQTAADLQEYYAKKDEFDANLSNVYTDFERTQLRKEFSSWKEGFFAGRPLVQEELSQGSQKAIERLKTVDELQDMLSKNLNIMPRTEAALREMMNVYVNYKNEKARLDQYGTRAMVNSLQDDTAAKLRKLSEYNENTKAAYDVLFSRLPGIGG